jgi:hypothetical protein
VFYGPVRLTGQEIRYFNKSIANVTYTMFLGLVIDDTVTWDNQFDLLISRWNSACYSMTAVKGMLSGKALRMLHFSYVLSVVFSGINFWGNTHNSIKIIRIKQNKEG